MNSIIGRKIPVMAVVLVLLLSAIVSPKLCAQQREAFFIAPTAEISGYGWNGIAWGGGIIIGAGTGGALGLQLLYAADNESFVFLEMLFFLRVYIYGADAYSGPFVQLNLGPVLYADTKAEITGYGNFSIGLNTGWRFLAGTNWYIEPAFRLGYPYLAGAGLSIGYRTAAGEPRRAENEE